MSGRPTPRLHRLPVRTDYVLVPAPLDLSLPQMTEKSTLPAIIVTPCSPSSARDFSIAFIQPPPKLPLHQRLTSLYHYHTTSLRLRSIILLLLLVFVLLCHLLTHQLASAYRPRMDMEQNQQGESAMMTLKSVQQSFSWSRIMGMGVGSGHGATPAVANPNAAVDVDVPPVVVVGSTVSPNTPAAHGGAPDILGMALDADAFTHGAGRVDAL